MINIKYTGQFGNCMFQYSFARLLALHNKMNLGTHGPLEIECTSVPTYHEQQRIETRTIDDNFYFNHRCEHGSTIPILDSSYDYVVDGYFQDADLYNNNYTTVRNFFTVEPLLHGSVKNDTLVMVRLGDFNHGGSNSEIIHYDWYREVFKHISGNRDFTITSNGRNLVGTTEEQEQKYLSNIISVQDTIIPSRTSMIEEFREVLSYNKVVCSNSTWAWWASFLGSAEKIYTFNQFGSFGVEKTKSHGVHINNLHTIRGVECVIDGNFLDLSKL